jgi:hypothetical protein
MGASRKKAVGEVFGGGLPTNPARTTGPSVLHPVIFA